MIRVDERKIPWTEGMTVADVLAGIEDADHCAVVRMNDEYISRHNFGKTRVPDGAVLFLIPMIAGG